MKFGKLYDLQVLQSWNNVNIPQFLKLGSKRIWILRQLGLGIPGLGEVGIFSPQGKLPLKLKSVRGRNKGRETRLFPTSNCPLPLSPVSHHQAAQRPQQTSLLNLATLNVKFLYPLS